MSPILGPRRRSRLRAAALALVLGGPGLLPASGCADRGTAVDLVLRGATVVDGTGLAGHVADVAVDGDRIHSVGPGLAARGRTEIDVAGRVVAPGFVDLHSHADLILLAPRETRQSLLEAKISQGVTSIVVGNCGLGPAPATATAAAILADVNGWMTPDGVAPGALSVGDYLDRLEASDLPLNVGTLVPHGPLRISAMGLAAGRPTAKQREAMRAGLERALEHGALGLSVGLIYPPGMYSATDELVELAHVVSAAGGLVTAHVRGSSETLIEATRELVDVARRSGAAVHHSHLEAVGRRFWPDVARVLALEDEARTSGLRISHDVFPYTRAATMMAAIFPPWALEGGVPALLRRLEDPATRERMRGEIATHVPRWPTWVAGGWPHNLVGAVGWDGIVVASVRSDGPSELVGRSLADIAAARGAEPFDVVAELMLAEQGQVGQLVDEISGRDEDRQVLLDILAHPAAAVVSDAEDYGRGLPHPAHAGAFVRALRLARERGIAPLEELVRRMTSHPARIVGLVDRGVLRTGAFADLVVFDADTVGDRADWEDPRRRASGVEYVIVNGRIVVERGVYRGGWPGHVLRKDR